MSKNGNGRITNVGQDASGQTVIYVQGTSSEIADTKFSMKIPDGPYASYNLEVAKKLKGMQVIFTYLSTNDVRVPRSITFKSVVE